MAEKKVTITVDGKEVVCNFGVNWYYKFYYENTGKDLLVTGLEPLASSQMFEMLPALYYSGYLAECKMNKVQPELKQEDFENMLLSADETVAGKMLADFLQEKGVSKEGETVAQT